MWRIFVIALVMSSGCRRKQVDIRKEDNVKDIGGRQFVVDLLATYTASERTAADFGELYKEVYQMQALLHESVMWNAELNLSMEALRLLDLHKDNPASDMATALAKTVVPYALDLPPPSAEVSE
ncbi:MAG: hypothetical protein KDE31_13115, partial [Caldilineaceae bacterium]|nr:hypothetical protein [Caldilineaceae bacterium]